MRKMVVQLLITTVCMLGAGLASAETDAQSQPDRREQQPTAERETKHQSDDKERNSYKNDNCSGDAKRSQSTEGDPDAPQNKVEYGGGG